MEFIVARALAKSGRQVFAVSDDLSRQVFYSGSDHCSLKANLARLERTVVAPAALARFQHETMQQKSP